MFEKLKRLAREPLVHFLLAGVGIYLAYGWFATGDGDTDQRIITVTAGDVEAMGDQRARLWGRPPTQEELAVDIRDFVRTQVLYREAMAMGLDKGDLVIQRRLAQKLELLAQGLITPEDPSEETLHAWYEAHEANYREPDQYAIAHVFFDPDQGDKALLERAEIALAELRNLDQVPEDFASYGDRFLLESYYPGQTEAELRRLFGSGFAEQIVKLEPGGWHGPILSGYGVHLVMIVDVERAPQPPFESVEAQVRQDWLNAQVEELSERFIDNLVSRYEIDIEEVSLPMTVPDKVAGQ